MGPSASTSLYLRPSSPGSFTVTVRGRDNNGRLVRTRTIRVDAIDPHPADTYSETFVGTTEVREYVPEVLVSSGTTPVVPLEIQIPQTPILMGIYDGGSLGGPITRYYTATGAITETLPDGRTITYPNYLNPELRELARERAIRMSSCQRDLIDLQSLKY